MTVLASFEFPAAVPMAILAVATFNGEFGLNNLLFRSGNKSRDLVSWLAVLGMLGLCRIWTSLELVLWAVPGLLVADIFSGLFHFLGDVLRLPSFWEHHTDPMLMTHNSFVFRNGEIFFLGAVFHPILVAQFPSLALAIDVGTMLAMFSNETHRWAHLRRVGKPIPQVVQTLQSLGVILTPERHARHHRGTFSTHFAIFAGITDPLTNPLWTRIHDYFHPPNGLHPHNANSYTADEQKAMAEVKGASKVN